MYQQSEPRVWRNRWLRRQIWWGELWYVTHKSSVHHKRNVVISAVALRVETDMISTLSGISTSCNKPSRRLSHCFFCRLWEKYVQDVTYCGRSERRGRGVSLAGQPPCKKLWSRVWSLHHQSTLAGYCGPLCARWRQDKVAPYIILQTD